MSVKLNFFPKVPNPFSDTLQTVSLVCGICLDSFLPAAFLQKKKFKHHKMYCPKNRQKSKNTGDWDCGEIFAQNFFLE